MSRFKAALVLNGFCVVFKLLIYIPIISFCFNS